jgi:general secretion pathway protein I
MNKTFCRNTFFLHRLRPTGGFTLMETLVAMMLLAISLVVILQLFSGGLKSGKMADDYTRAVFYAREKMEEYLLMDDFQEGSFEGTFDENYRWLVDIKLVEPEDGDEKEDENEKEISLVDLFHVDVSVFWPVGGREKKFQINTLKISEKKQDDAG